MPQESFKPIQISPYDIPIEKTHDSSDRKTPILEEDSPYSIEDRFLQQNEPISQTESHRTDSPNEFSNSFKIARGEYDEPTRIRYAIDIFRNHPELMNKEESRDFRRKDNISTVAFGLLFVQVPLSVNFYLKIR